MDETEITAIHIEELIKSITESGLMQPIVVRKSSSGYELIDGHRRLLAYRKLNRPKIEAIVKDASDKEAQILSVVGNLQRKNLTNIEMALAYQKILDNKLFKDIRELSKAIGKDETFVADTLNLLKLDKRIIEDLARNNSVQDVRLLRTIRRYDNVNEEGISDKQYSLYQRVINEKLDRDAVAAIAKGEKKDKVQVAFDIIKTKGALKISFNMRTFSKEKRKIAEKLLNEKLKEIVKMLED